MKTVLILGIGGMLGFETTKHFLNSNKFNVMGTYNGTFPTMLRNTKLMTLKLDVFRDPIDKLPTNAHYVINCIGMIKQRQVASPTDYYLINSKFPKLLANYCNENGMKLIHVSTDCVYDGLSRGVYTEVDAHTATDDYGLSKSLGEPHNCLTLRTSIIGEELVSNYGLLEFVRTTSQGKAGNPENPIKGFDNHYWNGITTLQLAKAFKTIINTDNWVCGVRHIYSPKDMTKHELVSMISKIYEIDKKIVSYQTPQKIDRTLRTKHEDFLKLFDIPSIEKQLDELKRTNNSVRK